MFGKDKKRPSSADGERPTSSKFVRPCPAESSRPGSADDSRSSSARSSRPSSPKKRPSSADRKKSRRAPSDDSGPAKSSRPTSPKKRPNKPGAFSTNSSLKGSRDSSPKSSLRFGSASEGASPKSSRSDSPAGSSKSRSSTFRRLGSPYPPNSKNSTRPCSPDYKGVDFEDTGGAFSEKKKQIKTKSPRGRPSPEIAPKFSGGKNPASKLLMQVMTCAATARAPFPETKVRRVVFYKNTDKENLVDELQSLKAAVADQAYHFQLHKTNLHGLQTEQNELEAKIAVLERIDGCNAPRTGGKSRLDAKISGLRILIGNLTDDITKHQETIQNLKYRYQVCLTREVTIQRDLAAGDVWRLQKQEIKLSIKEVEKVSKQFTDDSYVHFRAVDKAKRRVSGLLDEGKRMRAKLKQERESKRKNQQDVWIIGYETCMLVKENKQIERQKKLKEAAIAAKAVRASLAQQEKNKKDRKKRW